MSVANPKTSLSVRDQVSKDEWEVRVNLAAAYRLVALYGWDDLVFTHISVVCRDPIIIPSSIDTAGCSRKLPRLRW